MYKIEGSNILNKNFSDRNVIDTSTNRFSKEGAQSLASSIRSGMGQDNITSKALKTQFGKAAAGIAESIGKNTEELQKVLNSQSTETRKEIESLIKLIGDSQNKTGKQITKAVDDIADQVKKIKLLAGKDGEELDNLMGLSKSTSGLEGGGHYSDKINSFYGATPGQSVWSGIKQVAKNPLRMFLHPNHFKNNDVEQTVSGAKQSEAINESLGNLSDTPINSNQKKPSSNNTGTKTTTETNKNNTELPIPLPVTIVQDDPTSEDPGSINTTANVETATNKITDTATNTSTDTVDANVETATNKVSDYDADDKNFTSGIDEDNTTKGLLTKILKTLEEIRDNGGSGGGGGLLGGIGLGALGLGALGLGAAGGVWRGAKSLAKRFNPFKRAPVPTTARAAASGVDDAARAAASGVDDAARLAGATDDAAKAVSGVDDAARAASGADDAVKAASRMGTVGKFAVKAAVPLTILAETAMGSMDILAGNKMETLGEVGAPVTDYLKDMHVPTSGMDALKQAGNLGMAALSVPTVAFNAGRYVGDTINSGTEALTGESLSTKISGAIFSMTDKGKAVTAATAPKVWTDEEINQYLAQHPEMAAIPPKVEPPEVERAEVERALLTPQLPPSQPINQTAPEMRGDGGNTPVWAPGSTPVPVNIELNSVNQEPIPVTIESDNSNVRTITTTHTPTAAAIENTIPTQNNSSPTVINNITNNNVSNSSGGGGGSSTVSIRNTESVWQRQQIKLAFSN